MPARNFSVDKQMCDFQGKLQHKVQWGKHKRPGDGLQVDSLAGDGYTFMFNSCNKLIEQKCLDMGFSPMHCCLLGMWSKLNNK